MKRPIILITFLCTIPLLAVAEDTLYQCTKNGETVLQDRKPKDCDVLKKYTYESYANELEEPEGLRPREKKSLKSAPILPTAEPSHLSSLYQQSLEDNRRDKCYFYKKQVEDALNSLQFLGGEINQSSLKLKILQAESNMRHYCGKKPDIIYPRPHLQYSPYFKFDITPEYHISPGPAGP